MKSSSKSSIIRWWLFVVILMDIITTDNGVEACGAFFCQPQQPILQAGESIAFGVEQNGDYVNVTMVVQINYQGPAEDFAWLLPVPVVPELGVGSDLLFSALFQATQPNFSFSIDESLITTCGSRGPKTDEKCGGGLRSENEAQPITQSGNADPTDDGVDIQARGAVGPFDFVTLQLSDGEDDPGVIFDWLEENGYDQPDESDTLISYYASMGMTFVALRLRKDNDDGDIRPLILKYSIEGSLDSTSVACVPIQLTAIAATPRMPIQVYTLGPSRGVPFNFFNVKLDFRFIDWIGCQSRFNQIPCYYNSYLSLFQAAIRDVKGHAFVTEYAGPVDPIVSDIIPGRLSEEEDITTLSNQVDPDSFLQTLTTFLGFGASFAVNDLINSVLEEHIRHRDCPDLPVYPPGRTCGGLESVNQTDINFAEMARQLDQVVFEPAREAQVWLNSYPYLSRLYAQLDPSQMTKDPFFAFTEDLPEVSRNHSAVGVPVCDEDRHGRAIEIRIDDESTTTTISTHVDAEYTCSGLWRFQASSDLLCTASTSSSSNPPPALELASLSFTGEQSRTIQANAEGIYLESEIEELVLIMDSRVPEQLGLSIGNNQMPSDGDSGELLPECVGVYHDGSFSGTKISLETAYYCIFILLGVSAVLIRA